MAKTTTHDILPPSLLPAFPPSFLPSSFSFSLSLSLFSLFKVFLKLFFSPIVSETTFKMAWEPWLRTLTKSSWERNFSNTGLKITSTTCAYWHKSTKHYENLKSTVLKTMFAVWHSTDHTLIIRHWKSCRRRACTRSLSRKNELFFADNVSITFWTIFVV